MHPILLRLGPLTPYTYGLMMVVAFASVTWLSTRALNTLPSGMAAITSEQLVDLCCAALLGGIVGGRLFYVVLHWDEFAPAPVEALAIWRGGLVWYGGFLGSLTAGWLYVRAKRLTFLRVADHLMPFIALGHGLGRMGCFFNGCCYGRPTDAWCGVIFPGHDTAVLPTQLFEALGLFFLYIALRRMQQPATLRRPGLVFAAYMIGYAILRFLIEGLRGDQTPFWIGWTLQQVISVGLIAAGVVLLSQKAKGKIQKYNSKGKSKTPASS